MNRMVIFLLGTFSGLPFNWMLSEYEIELQFPSPQKKTITRTLHCFVAS